MWIHKGICFGFLICAVAVQLSAQSGATGTVVGTVVDSSGAAVSGASISIVNRATNATQQTTSSSSGTYAVSLLNPGTYKISASYTGFSKQVVDGVVVAVGQELRVDLSLKPGDVSQTVDVSASATRLDTDNAAIGQVITSKAVVDLPLNGRNFTQLLLLGPGAVQNSGEQGTFRAGEGNSLTIQGARPSSNQYYLDGININDAYYQVPAVIPSIDAIQEFQEQTKGYSAAYGGGANQINISTRSGTNALHGAAYDFLRNSALDARNFFDGQTISPLRQNQFGYTLGGPVMVPKLYDGRNKTFFLANYEGLRTRTSSVEYATVPTTAELNGIFPSAIIDPATQQPFPNNTVPRDRFSPFAGSAITHFPAPNINLARGNYQYSLPFPTNADQQTYRFDQLFGTRDSLFVRYTQTEYTPTQGGAGGGGGSFAEALTSLDEVTHGIVLNYTHTFSPSTVNQFRFGWLHETVNLSGRQTTQSEYSALGLQNLYPFNSFTTYPVISFNNSNSGLSPAGGANYSPQQYDQPTYQSSDTLTLNKGAHNISVGIDARWWTGFNLTFNSPSFNFDGHYTGNPVGDLLLGDVQQAIAQQPTPFAKTVAESNSAEFHFRQIAPWIQDDWKVNSRLTVNVGVRYDFSMRPFETNDKMFWLDPSIVGGGVYTANKQIIQQGLGGDLYAYGGDRSPGSTQWLVFSPRFGFAFRPFNDDKTVIRGGYGIFYDSSEAKEAATAGLYPFALSSTVFNTNTANLFPAVPALAPVTTNQLGFLFIEPSHIATPYVQDWTFSVEHELFKGIKMEVDYLGSKGTHLLGRVWQNAPYPYNPANPSPVSARVPYPNLGLIINHFWDFNSNYNAMNLKFEHAGQSLTFLAAYTWSRSMDVKSGTTGINADSNGNGPMNEYNWRLDYGPSSFDVTQRFVGSAVYELPIGRGRALLGNSGRAANLLGGGWQLNGILTRQTGFPFTVNATDLGFINQNYAQRADVVGNPYPSGFQQGIESWFNTKAFAQPVLGTFGNSGRNVLRGPASINLDLSLFKDFAFTERARLQTRLETFNVLNHANFGFPGTGVGTPQFGVISSAAAGRIVQVAMKVIW